LNDNVIIVTSLANRTQCVCVLFSPPVMNRTHKWQKG